MTVMLQTIGLTKSFTLHLRAGLRLPVLSCVDLEVRTGECVVLTGPSGAGKSTLLRSLYGNYRAEGGSILARHQGEMIDIAAAPPRTVLAVRHETLGYVSQFLRVVPRVSALDVVAEALVILDREADEPRLIGYLTCAAPAPAEAEAEAEAGDAASLASFPPFASFVSTLLALLPIAVDSSVPYASSSRMIVATVVALAVYGWRTSLGGRPILGAAFFGD